MVRHSVNNFRPDTWFIDDNPVGQLYVNFDICSNIVEYTLKIDDIYTFKKPASVVMKECPVINSNSLMCNNQSI